MNAEAHIVYPSIIFKLRGTLYAIGSRQVTSILQLPAYQRLPDAPPEFIGIFTHRGQIVPLLDARLLFRMSTLLEEFETFTGLLEQRKQDHINWVKELERATRASEKFTLATDPHKCAFGQWYYAFKSDNHAISFQLKKIEEPHAQLHRAAFEMTECDQNHEMCSREECLKVRFERLKNDYMPSIIGVLDETKEAFRAAYHQIVIVVDNGCESLGLVVDEILAVENLSDMPGDGALNLFSEQRYVAGVKQSEKQQGLILLLDDERLLALTSRAATPA